MDGIESVALSLTGPDSHVLVRRLGVGSLSIGPPCGRDDLPDLAVGPDDRLDWSVFNPFDDSAGLLWPRWLSYTGNDSGFLAWSASRPIESFTWTPARAMEVDARDARIERLTLNLRGNPLRIVLPRAHGLRVLTVTGEPSLLEPDLVDAEQPPGLTFRPDTKPSRLAAPIGLPRLDAVAGCQSIEIHVSALRQPFDCASLTQFSALRRVSLSGAMVNLAALSELPEIEMLRLLDCPHLTGLPSLSTWPRLRTIIASNIQESTGTSLRAQIRALAQAGHRWDIARATGLRRADWFDREHSLPFSQWPAPSARAATAAYRAAEVTIGAATTQSDVKAAVTAFAEVFNTMPGIDILEREDIAEAVCLLADAASFEVPVGQALTWLDHTRAH